MSNNTIINQYNKIAKIYNLRFANYLKGTTDKIAEIANSMPGDNILDVGCGTGELLFKLAQKFPNVGELVGIDISEEMLKQAKLKLHAFKSISLHSGTVEQIPYPNEHFNLIVSIGVIHYVRNPELMISEVLRVLKPGGYFLLIDMAQESFTTKISSILRKITDPGALQFYSMQSISEILNSQRFQVCSGELFKAGIFGLYLIKAKK